MWFDLLGRFIPVVCRVEFPAHVQARMVSTENPGGTMTNLDLEMAGLLLHWLVLEELVMLRHEPVGAFCDNIPTVAWAA